MKSTKSLSLGVLALVVLASVVFSYPAAAAQPPKQEKLMQEMVAASGKVGALKRKLIDEVEPAKERYEEIQKLREKIDTLNREIDEVLAKENAEYRKLLKAQQEAATRYEAVKKSKAAGKK